MTHHWSSPREFNMHITKIWWGIIYSLPVRQFNTNLVQKILSPYQGSKNWWGRPTSTAPAWPGALRRGAFENKEIWVIYGDGTFLLQKGSWISQPNVRFQ